MPPGSPSPVSRITWVDPQTASWRQTDHPRKRHHKEDVIVGGVIGIFSGTICYLLYWPNPFSVRSFSIETMGRPRLDLANVVAIGSRGGEGYRLAPEGPDFETV